MPAISRDIEIVTDRLKLRAASIADADLVWSASRVAGFNDWMTWDAPESRAELEDIARKNEQEWVAGNSYTFTIELLSNGQGIGRLAIRREDSPDTWNIGYWIHPDYWSQGYATEAGRAIIELGKSDLSALKITTGHAIANSASQKVIEKLGFIRTGENPCGFTKLGESVPEYEYAISFNAH
jgi:ribosomal-protein-alanine N-acetyltransferase